jgi:hypothetical protein
MRLRLAVLATLALSLGLRAAEPKPVRTASCSRISTDGVCSEYDSPRKFAEARSECEALRGLWQEAPCATPSRIGSCTFKTCDGRVCPRKDISYRPESQPSFARYPTAEDAKKACETRHGSWSSP